MTTVSCQVPIISAKDEQSAIILAKRKNVSIEAEPFTIEEHPLNVSGQGILNGKRQQLGKDILAKRAAWRREPYIKSPYRESHYEKLRASMNDKLAPFGYKLLLTRDGWRSYYHCDLYCDNTLILQNIDPRSVEVNESGTDFAFVADNAPNERPSQLLIQKDSIKPYDYNVNAIYPVFLGDNLLTVEWGERMQEDCPEYIFKVKRGNDVLYTGSAIYSVINPIRSLYAKNGHWILEVDRQIIIDGTSLNQQLSYDNIFRYVFFKDKPLYFFEKRGLVGISYDNNILPNTYEKVPHYGCCDSPGIAVNEDMLWFYGLRDGIWYYVEMGIYE